MDVSKPTSPTQASSSNLGQCIAKIAAVLSSESYSSGDRAALKRMTPEKAPPLAFYRFAFRHLPDFWETRQQEWMTIVAGIAIMSRNPHNPRQPVGSVLAESGYSENRLERLLAAKEDMLHVFVLRTARFLAAHGEAVNWNDFARLVLSQDLESSDVARHAIARDYYRHLKRDKE